MSTRRELSAAGPELPGVAAACASGEHAASEGRAGDPPSDVRTLRSRLVSRLRLPRPTTVLAPTLPALMLLGLSIAGLSDPPDAPVRGSGSVSRLHITTDRDPSPAPTRP